MFAVLDYLGTFALGVTGASIGARIGMDFFGIVFLAFLTAVGGGTVRDLLIDQQVFWTNNSIYFYIIFLVCCLSFIVKDRLKKLSPVLFFLDTLGLGFYAIVGTQKTLTNGYGVTTALIMGVVSGVLGGIIRSLFSKEVSILYNKELYATIAGATSLIYIGLDSLDLNQYAAVFLTLGSSVTLRYLTIRYGIKLPKLKEN